MNTRFAPNQIAATRETGPRAGFTLLEVMASVAILGLLLTAIFSSEAGAIKMAHRSRKTGVASLLVRCKMGEIEQQMAKEGFPALYASGSDECCEGAEVEGFSCDWTVNRIVLPDTMFLGEEQNDMLKQMQGSASNMTQAEATNQAQAAASATGQPDLLKQAQTAASATGPLDLTEVMAGNPGSASNELAAFALPFIYPVLKPFIEDQIRRATVTVKWREGAQEHSFDVIQYLIADQPPLMPSETTGSSQTGSQSSQSGGGP